MKGGECWNEGQVPKKETTKTAKAEKCSTGLDKCPGGGGGEGGGTHI